MYFVIYDFKDNLIAYIDSLEELAQFVNRRKKQLKYLFKHRDVIQVQNNTIFNIYKFDE